MSGRYSEHDHEHYERPRRRTRPRTKERPSYDDAVDAQVVTVDRGRFTLTLTGPGADPGLTVLAMKSRPLGRKGVVVGDRVRVVGDVSGRVARRKAVYADAIADASEFNHRMVRLNLVESGPGPIPVGGPLS